MEGKKKLRRGQKIKTTKKNSLLFKHLPRRAAPPANPRPRSSALTDFPSSIFVPSTPWKRREIQKSAPGLFILLGNSVPFSRSFFFFISSFVEREQ